MSVNKKNVSEIKDILIEQWNEFFISNDDLVVCVEENLGRELEQFEKLKLDQILKDWNSFGLNEYIQIEKSVLEDKSKNYAECEKFVEEFISERF